MKQSVWTQNSDTGKLEYPGYIIWSKDWQDLNTLDAKISACAIPTNILNRLSTRDLLELVLDYPLNMNIFLYTTISDGIRNIAGYNPALRAFLGRPDAVNILYSYCKDNSVHLPDSDASPAFLRKILLYGLANQCSQPQDTETALELGPLVQVQTPMGSFVDVHDQNNEVDLSDHDKETMLQWILASYPGITIVGEPTIKYNCHSYAWFMQSDQNHYWMNDPSAYWEDHSYFSTGNEPNAYLQKVYYPADGAEHSGIVVEVSSGTIISKWGSGPLVIHKWDNCPYVYDSVNREINYYH